MPCSAYQTSGTSWRSLGGAAVEQLAQVHAVVRGTRLLAEHDEVPAALSVELDEALAEALRHHAVSHDHQRAASIVVRHHDCLSLRLLAPMGAAASEFGGCQRKRMPASAGAAGTRHPVTRHGTPLRRAARCRANEQRATITLNDRSHHQH